MSIEEIKEKIIPLLIRHQVRRAGIFGSVAKENDFVGMKLELEDLLERTVDLVEYQATKPRLREKTIEEEVRIYG